MEDYNLIFENLRYHVEGEVVELLKEFLSSAKSAEQKRMFISNLFSKMKKEDMIISQENKWFLATPKLGL